MSKKQLYAVSYGGGVNSVAVLVRLKQLRIVPVSIVMADPGSERAETIRFRDEVLPAWLNANGFPRVTVITRIEQGQGRPAGGWRRSVTSVCGRRACRRLPTAGRSARRSTRGTRSAGGLKSSRGPSRSGRPAAS